MNEGLLERYGSREGAEAYARKYTATPLRRLSNRRELSIVRSALVEAGTTGEALDVPCAAGRLVPVLLERAARVTAVDVAATMVEVARRELAGPIAEGRAVVLEGDAAALPFPDGAFDTAVCWRLLHHLVDRGERLRVLRELARVARGAVIVTFADAGTLRARLQALRGRDRRCVKLSRDEFASEARDAGLTLVSARRLSSCFSLLCAAVLRRV